MTSISLTTPKHRILAQYHSNPQFERRLMATLKTTADPDKIASLDRALAIIDSTVTLQADTPEEILESILSGCISRRQAEAVATDEQYEVIQDVFALRTV